MNREKKDQDQNKEKESNRNKRDLFSEVKPYIDPFNGQIIDPKITSGS